MISRKVTLLFALIVGLCTFALVHTAYSATVVTDHSVQTCNSYGAAKNVFSPSEDVYLSGAGFPHSATFDLYIVTHQTTWTDGETIPSRIAGTATTVSTDASGKIPPTIVWPHVLVPGKYDIVIDENHNGKYDKDIDCLDANSINVNSGFLVIPEYVLGAALGLTAFFAAYGIFRFSKSRARVTVE